MAAAAVSSSLLPSTSPRRFPFPPARKLHSAAKAPTLTTKPLRLARPLASSSSSSPPPTPEEAEPKDPIELAFARAAAYRKERDSPPSPPPPTPAPPPQLSAAKEEEEESRSSKEAFARAVEYRNGNGEGLGGGGGSALLGALPRSGQSTFASEDGAFGKFANKKEEYEYDETDFLGLDFFEKKRYKGPPPGLAPAADPFPDEDFPEVEIIIGDPSKFGKTRHSTEIQPVDDREPEETSHSTTEEKKEDNKLEETPPSTFTEAEEDDDEDEYKPTVRSWGMFPRPQNISKAYGGGRNIRLGGETQSAEEKAAKDKRTRELIAAYRNRQNMIVDAKTKAECTKTVSYGLEHADIKILSVEIPKENAFPRSHSVYMLKALKEGDELMNTGRLKQALPYYEKVMQAVDFKTELHGMAALQWSICLDSLCRSKEAMSMYSKLKNHPNSEISKKANMFMFSFQAMDFMKVNSSPLPRNTGYEKYFDKFGGQKNYYATLDESEMGIDQIIPYMIFLVSPIFLVAFVALRKSFQL